MQRYDKDSVVNRVQVRTCCLTLQEQSSGELCYMLQDAAGRPRPAAAGRPRPRAGHGRHRILRVHRLGLPRLHLHRLGLLHLRSWARHPVTPVPSGSQQKHWWNKITLVDNLE